MMNVYIMVVFLISNLVIWAQPKVECCRLLCFFTKDFQQNKQKKKWQQYY